MKQASILLSNTTIRRRWVLKGQNHSRVQKTFIWQKKVFFKFHHNFMLRVIFFRKIFLKPHQRDLKRSFLRFLDVPDTIVGTYM